MNPTTAALAAKFQAGRPPRRASAPDAGAPPTDPVTDAITKMLGPDAGARYSASKAGAGGHGGPGGGNQKPTGPTGDGGGAGTGQGAGDGQGAGGGGGTHHHGQPPPANGPVPYQQIIDAMRNSQGMGLDPALVSHALMNLGVASPAALTDATKIPAWWLQNAAGQGQAHGVSDLDWYNRWQNSNALLGSLQSHPNIGNHLLSMIAAGLDPNLKAPAGGWAGGGHDGSGGGAGGHGGGGGRNGQQGVNGQLPGRDPNAPANPNLPPEPQYKPNPNGAAPPPANAPGLLDPGQNTPAQPSMGIGAGRGPNTYDGGKSMAPVPVPANSGGQSLPDPARAAQPLTAAAPSPYGQNGAASGAPPTRQPGTQAAAASPGLTGGGALAAAQPQPNSVQAIRRRRTRQPGFGY